VTCLTAGAGTRRTRARKRYSRALAFGDLRSWARRLPCSGHRGAMRL